MKRLLPILAITGLYISPVLAQTDTGVLRQIREEIMWRGTCYDNLRVLSKTIGHRLSGSVGAAKAITWGVQALKEAGADSVWLQPVLVPHWVRGKEYLKLQLAGSKLFAPVKMLSLGNAAGTDGKMLQAPVIMVHTLDEFRALPPDQVRGKIVFFNYRFRQDWVNTFHGYGDAVRYRGLTPELVARKGGVAVIIRSVSTGLGDIPHTGMTRYVDSVRKIPAVAIGNSTADRLEASLKGGTVSAQLLSEARMMDPVISYNVIGEIRGAQLPGEYIAAGGHLDTWDVGEGAHDDGAGCVQAIEMIRTFKALGIRPKRTVRAVLWMNEENGARGGRAYADSAEAKGERHIFAMESDAGGFSPRGIGLDMPEEKKAVIRGFAPLFADLNVYDFSSDHGGTDIDPLRRLGTALAGLSPDPQRYFDLHHTEADIFEAVNHRELKIGAVVMTYLVYLVSEHGL